MRRLSLLFVLAILFTSSSSRAAEEDPSPSPTIWPAHVAGIAGGVGLATAIAFGSLQINADHAARITEASLAGAGASPGACRSGAARADIGEMCSLLARHEAASDLHRDGLTVALAVGLTSLAFAAVWYVIAK